MADVEVKYNNSTIIELNASRKEILETSGKMMTDDVTIEYTKPTVPSGTAGTPVATKGAVANHSVAVTPSVTNATGYITGGTLTGSPVTVNASELVSGTLSISQNGTADVTNYASVDVNVSGGGGGIVTAQVYLNSNGNVWYTDVNMTQHQTSGVLSGLIPVGTIIVASTVEPGTTIGITKLSGYRGYEWYVVTG